MPSSEELKTAQELRAAGAPLALTELLAAKFEATAAASRDSALREFAAESKAFRSEVAAEFQNLHAEMKTLITESRASMEASLRGFMLAMIATIMGATGVAVAIIKLLPNWHWGLFAKAHQCGGCTSPPGPAGFPLQLLMRATSGPRFVRPR